MKKDLTFIYILSFLIHSTYVLNVEKIYLAMPNVHPDKDDSTFCTSRKINSTIYIVAFEPKASTHSVHHLIVYGCPQPGSKKSFWDCGESQNPSVHSTPQKNNVCSQDDPSVIYAWALNASPFQLPKDVAFKIGKQSQIGYLVLQIHYAQSFDNDETDSSGLNIVYTKQRQKKLAGILVLASEGKIAPHRITDMETVCQVRENKTVYPFAYRVHTHELGTLVAGYSSHKDRTGVERWYLLGKRSPQEAQMFYPVVNKRPVTFKDKLAARCTMDSRQRSEYTFVGPKHHDEMCNFYVVYYVERGEPLEMRYCISTRQVLKAEKNS